MNKHIKNISIMFIFTIIFGAIAYYTTPEGKMEDLKVLASGLSWIITAFLLLGVMGYILFNILEE